MNNTPIISNEFQIIPRKTDSIVPLLRRDWNKIKGDLERFSEGTDWWTISFTSFLSVTITLWPIIYFGGNEIKNYEWLFRIALIATAITIAIFLFMKSIKKNNFSTKKNLQEDMKYIEDSFNFEAIEQKQPLVESETKSVEKKTLNKTKEAQGLNYIPLSLSSGLLNSATFEFISNSTYWRTGFKLMKPNASSEITTLGSDTALFHLTRTDNSLGIDIYPDGKFESGFHKLIEGLDYTKPISITIDRNENNFVNFYINDVVEYNGRFDSELFKKVAILVWGDDKEYSATINRIEYDYS